MYQKAPSQPGTKYHALTIFSRNITIQDGVQIEHLTNRPTTLSTEKSSAEEEVRIDSNSTTLKKEETLVVPTEPTSSQANTSEESTENTPINPSLLPYIPHLDQTVWDFLYSLIHMDENELQDISLQGSKQWLSSSG